MTSPYLYQEIDRIYAKTIGRGIRSLCVSASMPNEGTTTVVCALAQRARAVNLNVLVVDMNLYNPAVSKLIDRENSPIIDYTNRLSHAHPQSSDQHNGEVMANAGDPNERVLMSIPHGWDDAVDYHARSVDVLGGPSLPVISIPKNIINPVRFREQAILSRMIEQWQNHYDCIIFDTSPLCLINQQNIPAQHIATCCDSTILVVKSGQTLTHQLTEAMSILQTVDISLAGTVLNDYENPLLGVELLRQCEKLSTKMPRLSAWLRKKIEKKRFLFAEF